MTFLMYVESFASVLVLLTSTTIIAGWALIRLADTLVRIYVAVTELETGPVRQTAWNDNADHLKRAGQW